MDSFPRHPTDAVTSNDNTPMSGVASPSQEIIRRLRAHGHRFAFEQVVRLLEQVWPDAAAPGETPTYTEGPVRIRPEASQAFPPTDVAGIEPDESGPARLLVTVQFHGLYGIDGSLPPRFREALVRGRADGNPHRDFLDIFNHRFYSFFYRAWKKYRPELHVRKGETGAHTNRILAVAGMKEARNRDEASESVRAMGEKARLVGAHPRNAAGLESLIGGFFEDLRVDVIENVPRWVSIPSRTGLGEGVRLGNGEPIGRKVFDRSGKFRIRLGPMGRAKYRSLLPEGSDARRLCRIVRLYAPDHLSYEVELNVLSNELPSTSLGGEGVRLGYTTRLGTAQNSVRTRVVEYEESTRSDRAWVSS